MVFEKLRNNGNIHFFVGRGKKGQAVFSPIVLSSGRGCSTNVERKDFTSGLAKGVRLGRIVVEGLCDFRRKGKNIVGRYLIKVSIFPNNAQSLIFKRNAMFFEFLIGSIIGNIIKPINSPYFLCSFVLSPIIEIFTHSSIIGNF